LKISNKQSVVSLQRGMSALHVHGQDVLVLGRVGAELAFELGLHPADELDVSPQVVHAREDVAALETRMAFFLVEFAKSSRLNAYKRQDVNARLGAGGGGVDQITPSTKVTLYC
jgi:hypothetical protein